MAVVSAGSGNCAAEILLTGLLAGVPWRGEEQGDERGEILARAPEEERELLSQNTSFDFKIATLRLLLTQ